MNHITQFFQGTYMQDPLHLGIDVGVMAICSGLCWIIIRLMFPRLGDAWATQSLKHQPWRRWLFRTAALLLGGLCFLFIIMYSALVYNGLDSLDYLERMMGGYIQLQKATVQEAHDTIRAAKLTFVLIGILPLLLGMIGTAAGLHLFLTGKQQHSRGEPASDHGAAIHMMNEGHE